MVDSSRVPGFSTSIYKTGLSRGLFTQASPLSVPEGFSPSMENVFINRRGNIRTRHGTQELKHNTQGKNTYLYVLRTKYGVTVLITKEGKSLKIFRINEVGNKELECLPLLTFDNVFSTEAEFAVPDFVYVSGESPRVIVTTGSNTPVFVRFTERQVINRVPSALLSVQHPGEYIDVPAQDLLLFKDGSLVPQSDYSFNGTQIVLPSAQVGEFDILHVGWYWCTEASVFYGLQLSQTISRFNTGPSDLSVATPLELLVGIQPIDTNVDVLPIIVYKNGNVGTRLRYANPPEFEDDFTFSGGSFRTTANKQKILPGITHITFGSVNADETDISELTFIRGVRLTEFNSGVLMPVSNYNVFVDTKLSAFTTVPQNDTYGSFYRAGTGSLSFPDFAGSPSSSATYILFTGTVNVGIPSPSVVRTVRTNPAKSGNSAVNFIGSAAISANTLPYSRAGSRRWWPMYGLQEHSDFYNGSFPSKVELHENRLVFSGFPSEPNRIVLSAVLDTTVRDDFYSDFQIQEQEGSDVNAVVIDINTVDAGGITAIKSASGTLFVFTLNSVYLVSGGDRGITPTVKFVTQIAGVGAVNANSVVVINNSVLFLSRSGMYALTQSFDAAGGWRVQIISEPINDRLVNPANTDVAWLTFLPNEDTLYVCVARQGTHEANELYLWKQDSNAWSKFTDYTGYWQATSGRFTDLSENYLLMSKAVCLVSYPYRYPIDEYKNNLQIPKLENFTLRTVQTLPFRVVPDVGIEDVGIVGDYIVTKLNETQILIDDRDVPTSGFFYPSGVNHNLVAVYRQDGARRTDVIFDIETGAISAIDPTDKKGTIYKCYATTPNLFVSSERPQSYLPTNKTVHTTYFVFHTNGEYVQFGVNIKKVDLDPTQRTPLNKFPSVDSSVVVAFDAATMDAARELVRPFWKMAIHPGGVEDFFQMIVLSDSPDTWELISLQSTVSQSSVRPGTGRI